MGKNCLSAWRILLLLLFHLCTAIHGTKAAIASSQVETESSGNIGNEAQIVFDTRTGNELEAPVVFATGSGNEAQIVFETRTGNELEAPVVFATASGNELEAPVVFATASGNELEAPVVFETSSRIEPETQIVFDTRSGNEVEAQVVQETPFINEPETQAIFEIPSGNEVEAQVVSETPSISDPVTQTVFLTSTSNEPQTQVVFQTSSINQGYPPPSPQKLQFRTDRQRFRSDPYTILRPPMEAQDRIFTELVTAATIVPKLFGASDKPLWVPHKYFNLCPLVDPNSDSMWAAGCAGFPNQINNGKQVPWASQQAAATAASEAGGGWGIAPMAPFANPMYMGPNNVLGLPPGYLGYPSMYPYYANPNPSMPPPALPQFVNNNEATVIDMGNMFASAGSSAPTGSSSSISSMFFNSLGMGGNPAATTEQLNNGMASYSGSGSNGMALYSGSGNNGMALYSGYGGGPSPMGGYPSPMGAYPFPMAIGILPPMGYGMGYGYDGYGLPPPAYGWPGDWNRNEKSPSRNEASSSKTTATASSTQESRNGDSHGAQE